MNVDAVALREVFSLTSGIWTMVAILALGVWRMWNGLPAVMAQWIAWRQQKQAEQLAKLQATEDAKSADWSRLRDEVARLAGRIEYLEGKVAECEHDRMHWMERAIHAESVLLGVGEVRQAAATAMAEVRLDAAEKAKAEAEKQRKSEP